MKTLVLIMSHRTLDPIFLNHEKTWKKIISISKQKKLPIDFLFMYSDEKLIEDYSVINDELISKCVENYWDSLLIKTINGFDFFLKSNYDLVFKTNLSTIINLNEFVKVCEKINSDDGFIYNGYIGQYEDYKFVSGAGMLLNKKTVEVLFNYKNEISEKWTDDIFFGFILNKLNKIEPIYGELTRYDIIFDSQSIDPKLIQNSTHIRIKIRKNNQDIYFTDKVYEILYTI